MCVRMDAEPSRNFLLFPFIPLPRIGIWLQNKVSDLREERREPYVTVVWYAKWQVFARSVSGMEMSRGGILMTFRERTKATNSAFEFLC